MSDSVRRRDVAGLFVLYRNDNNQVALGDHMPFGELPPEHEMHIALGDLPPLPEDALPLPTPQDLVHRLR